MVWCIFEIIPRDLQNAYSMQYICYVLLYTCLTEGTITSWKLVKRQFMYYAWHSEHGLKRSQMNTCTWTEFFQKNCDNISRYKHKWHNPDSEWGLSEDICEHTVPTGSQGAKVRACHICTFDYLMNINDVILQE